MRLFKLPHCYLLVIIIAFCVVSYFRTMDVPFFFDDFECISNNPLIRDFSNYFKDNIVVHGALLEDTVNTFKIRPLSFISFSINYYFGGVNIGGYHLVNIFIHMVNSLLIYVLLINLCIINSMRKHDHIDEIDFCALKCIAFMVSCIFSVHPVMTNAVTYITQRMTSLVVLFYLLSIVLYERYIICCSNGYKRASLYFLSILSCCAAMLTKEIAFTLPVMLLLFDIIFCESGLKLRLMRLTPFIVTMLIIPYNVIGLKNSEAGQTEGIFSTAINLVNFTGISSYDYLLTQVRVLIFYIRKLALPTGLSLEHDFPLSTSLFDSGVITSLLVHLVIFGFAIVLIVRSRKNDCAEDMYKKMAGFGIFWFYISLAVESTVIPITEVAVEYRLYLPAIGFFIFTVCTLHLVLKKYFPLIIAERLKLWMLCSIVMILMVATIARNEVWRDPVRFWRKTITQYPMLCRPYANLADYFIEKKRYEEARNVYRNAIKIIPDAQVLHYELGRLYIQALDFNRAIDEFMAAIQIAPWRTESYYGLAQAYAFRGDYERVDEILAEVRGMPD